MKTTKQIFILNIWFLYFICLRRNGLTIILIKLNINIIIKIHYRRNDWLVKCQLGHVIGNTSKVDSLILCSRHFESYYYDANGKLTIDATPTIFDWEHKKSTNLVPGNNISRLNFKYLLKLYNLYK